MNDLINHPQPPNASGKKYLFYRILGFINNFIAIFFLFISLMSFAAMGFQPRLLLYLFIFLAILIYTNLTNVFSRHVMVRGNNLRVRIKDWIKVNAIVSLLFAGFMLVSIILVLIDKTYIQKITDVYSNMQGVTNEMVRNIVPVIKGVLLFFGICMLLLVVHVILTFGYIKKFGHHFSNEILPPQQ